MQDYRIERAIECGLCLQRISDVARRMEKEAVKFNPVLCGLSRNVPIMLWSLREVARKCISSYLECT